ncbi:hypothetical protein FHR83_007017 [Actinoplanes campanulatus]|uniref:Glycosyl transferase family 2 n=1 Tax=Actinoplanes campanulatus TaxID=113559 RepID=A0A7W5FI48_9ACTN|nr:hypothetical protein [Actinoplanes campanulatus]MBB3099311.1 hypothetical protein [Actinoplanes campanulatus]GGN40526.1 hypothetical protein GCM10010109_69740 [Actinoplanes campanulatus]GID40629.1 hypothetical protein Aca09nite_71350 [Actinoplanes campanulatus]
MAEFTEGTVIVGFLDPGAWSACFGLSYRDLCLYDAASSQRIVRPGGKELRAVTGAGGIAVNRNKVARDFLDNTDGEWLWFVDSDMGFAPETVDQLVKSADPALRPVMGALCFAALRRKPAEVRTLYAERFLIQPTVYEYVETDGEVGFRPIIDYPRDQVMPVAGTGAACLLIHRSALEVVRARYGDAWFDPIVHPTGLKGRPRTFSEDLSFCIRLQAVDLPVHVDTAVKTTHEKGFIYLDEETFEAQNLEG